MRKGDCTVSRANLACDRTIPDISDLLVPLDEAIDTHFIPALTGHHSISDHERQLLALPTRLGGLGIAILSKIAPFERSSSTKVTAPLVALIVQQNSIYTATNAAEQQHAKQAIRMLRRQQQTSAADQLQQVLPRHLKRAMELGSEKGASSWLSALPMEELGFTLHKSDFRDALCLRYGWLPTNLPSKCACGASFSVEYALCCSMGGFPTIRHNEIRDFTANAMSEACHDVCIEPPLQALTTEPLPMPPPTETTEPVWTFGHRASGMTDTDVHFLMSGYSTPTHHLTGTCSSAQFIVDMRRRRGATKTESEK